MVINCIGVGTLNGPQRDYTSYFTVGEEYDNLVIGYLRSIRPDALYICFSSGAIYGRGFSKPVGRQSTNCIMVNDILPQDYYSITRINSEAKHRAFQNLRIIDLRVFSYFSRFIDLEDSYFITELLKAVINNKVFITDRVNIIRDYIHPEDIFLMIKQCANVGKLNVAFDMRSSKPVDKKEVIDYFSSRFGLKHTVEESLVYSSATGIKNIYCSNYDNTSMIGYQPKYSSMDTIKQEADCILRLRKMQSK